MHNSDQPQQQTPLSLVTDENSADTATQVVESNPVEPSHEESATAENLAPSRTDEILAFSSLSLAPIDDISEQDVNADMPAVEETPATEPALVVVPTNETDLNAVSETAFETTLELVSEETTDTAIDTPIETSAHANFATETPTAFSLAESDYSGLTLTPLESENAPSMPTSEESISTAVNTSDAEPLIESPLALEDATANMTDTLAQLPEHEPVEQALELSLLMDDETAPVIAHPDQHESENEQAIAAEIDSTDTVVTENPAHATVAFSGSALELALEELNTSNDLPAPGSDTVPEANAANEVTDTEPASTTVDTDTSTSTEQIEADPSSAAEAAQEESPKPRGLFEPGAARETVMPWAIPPKKAVVTETATPPVADTSHDDAQTADNAIVTTQDRATTTEAADEDSTKVAMPTPAAPVIATVSFKAPTKPAAEKPVTAPAPVPVVTPEPETAKKSGLFGKIKEWKGHIGYLHDLYKEDSSSALSHWKQSYKERGEMQQAMAELQARQTAEDFEWEEVARVLGQFHLREDDRGQAEWYSDAARQYRAVVISLEKQKTFRPATIQPLMKELKYIAEATEFHKKFGLTPLQEKVRTMYNALLYRIDEYNKLIKQQTEMALKDKEIEKVRAQEAVVAAEAQKVAQQNRLIQEQRMRLVEEKKRLEAKKAAEEAERQRVEREHEIRAEAAELKRRDELTASFRALETEETMKKALQHLSLSQCADGLLRNLFDKDNLDEQEKALAARVLSVLQKKLNM